jgi:polysaccharide pyruvyl transferase WcaK-like protein
VEFCQRHERPLRTTLGQGHPVVCLLVPSSASTEFQPVSRGPVERVRNRLRREADRLLWALGRPTQFHYSTWLDRANTNRGDIAIRLASRELIELGFGCKVEFIEISWDEVPQFDAAWINERADLFVVAGGGYYFLDRDGRLSPRIGRDILLLKQLTCPIISFCPGVNRHLVPGQNESDIHSDAVRELSELLDLLALSSIRDNSGREVLDRTRFGKTARLVDPALFLSSKRPPNFTPRPDDGALQVGLNIAFHWGGASQVMPDRVRVVAAAARDLAARKPCRFFYFVHYDSEVLIPWLLRQEGVPVTVVDAQPAEMLAWYGQLDLHICQMLHSSIFSLNSGVPTINLSYDIKNAAFFEIMGLDDYCLPGFDSDTARLTAMIDLALCRRADLVRHIAMRKAELRREMDAFVTAAVNLTLRAGRESDSNPAIGLDAGRPAGR